MKNKIIIYQEYRKIKPRKSISKRENDRKNNQGTTLLITK